METLPDKTKPKQPLIILGSARKNSDTQRLIRALFGQHKYNLVDLLDYHISPYTYTGHYPANDQFALLVRQMLQHDQLIFATPVYWYAMSGLLKVFFDRLTDLVTTHKLLGRQMKGKKVHLLTIGSDPVLPNGFEEPFKLTASYFGMRYEGCLYSSVSQLNKSLPCGTDFVNKIYNNGENDIHAPVHSPKRRP